MDRKRWITNIIIWSVIGQISWLVGSGLAEAEAFKAVELEKALPLSALDEGAEEALSFAFAKTAPVWSPVMLREEQLPQLTRRAALTQTEKETEQRPYKVYLPLVAGQSDLEASANLKPVLPNKVYLPLVAGQSDLEASANLKRGSTDRFPHVTYRVKGSGKMLVSPRAFDGVGQIVTLTAVAEPNWRFAGWLGDLSGAERSLRLRLNGTTRVEAHFIPSDLSAFEQDLVAYWPLDEPDGQREDLSGQGHHVTPTQRVGAGLGVSVSAIDLEEEQGDYLQLDSAQANLGLQDSFTFLGWLRAESVGGQERVLFSQGDSTSAGYEVLIGADAKIHFRSSVTRARTLVEKELAAYQWYHLSTVYEASGQRLSIYIDGELIRQTNLDLSGVASDRAFVLGARLKGEEVSHHFDGRLDEWRVYGRALGQSEILALMNQVVPPAPTAYARPDPLGLRAQWSLDTIQAHNHNHNGPHNRQWITEDGSGQDRHLYSDQPINTAVGVNGQGLAADLERDDGNYLSLPEQAQSGLGLIESVTFQGWLKAESLSEEMVILSLGDAQTKNAGYELFIGQEGKVHFRLSEDGDFMPYASQGLNTQKSISIAQWYYLSAVFDAAAQRLAIYIDGDLIEQVEVKFNELYPSSGPFLLGARLKDGQVRDHFDGQLARWQVYDVALSEAEIRAEMNKARIVTLSLETDGSGLIRVDPVQEDYRWGQEIVLSAQAEPGWSFVGWTGDGSGAERSLTLTLRGDRQVQAHFLAGDKEQLNQGLQGLWALDETTGLRLDQSGQGNDLTDYNGVAGARGQVAGAADFERDQKAYLQIEHAAQQGLGIQGDLSIAAWFQLKRTEQDMRLVSKDKSGGITSVVTERGYGLGIQKEPPRLRFMVSEDGLYNEAENNLDGKTVLEGGQWYHVGAVFQAQSQSMQLYLNGRLEATRTVAFSQIHPSSAAFRLGASHYQVSGYLDGLLDEVYVYERVLSQAELLALMHQVALSPTRPLSRALQMTRVGSGTVHIEPEQATYQAGQVVTLTAQAASYWDFEHWLNGTTKHYDNPLVLTLTHNSQVTVTFRADEITVFSLDEQGGIRETSDGGLQLDFAAGAVTQSLTITVGQVNHLQTTTDTLDGEAVLLAPQNGLPYQTFILDAQAAGGGMFDHVAFAAPVTLTVPYEEALTEAIVEDSLTFLYYHPLSETFVSVPTTVNTETRQVQAVVSHFSTYGLGGDSVAWQEPGIQAEEVNLFRGQVGYAYPLPLPSGPNGFGPNLTLRYDSGIVNSLLSHKATDTGWVGLGWTLGLGELRHNQNQVSLFGQSYDLERQHFFQRQGLSVRTKTGLQYFFGEMTEGGLNIGAHLAKQKHAGGKCQHRPRVFKLGKVVDRWGNTLTIQYRKINNGGRNCDYDNFVTGEAYPEYIWYTTNPAANDTHAEYMLHFQVVDKGYNARGESSYGDGSYYLDKVTVWYYPPDGTSRQHVRTINLDYDLNTEAKTNRLTRLEIWGDEAGSIKLPGTTFDYENRQVGAIVKGETTGDPAYHNGGQKAFLKWINSGYGAQVRYDYKAHQQDVREQGNSKELWQVLNQSTVSAFEAPTSQKTYHYQGFYTHKTDSRGYMAFVCQGVRQCLAGYTRVEVVNQLNYLSRYVFQAYDNEHHLLNGSLNQRLQYGPPAGDGQRYLYLYADQVWSEQSGAQPFAALDAVYDFTCNGLVSENNNDLNFFFQQCLHHKAEVYDYDHYGHQILRHEQDPGRQTYRTFETGYHHNTQRWLFLPKFERAYEGYVRGWLDTENNAAGRVYSTIYYNYNDQGVPNNDAGLPDQGPVYLSVQRVHGHQQETGQQLGWLDTRYQYDAYGNLTQQTVYKAYGTAGAYASAEPRTSVLRYDSQGLVPTQMQNTLGHSRTLTYDYRWQQATRETNPNGVHTVYHYDAFGRLSQVDRPRCGHPTPVRAFVAEYHDEEQPYREVARRYETDCSPPEVSTKSDFFYDGLGRLIQSHHPGDTAAVAYSQHWAYDALGRQLRSSLPLTLTGTVGVYQSGLDWNTLAHTHTAYDPLARPVQVTGPNGNTTRWAYGKSGSLASTRVTNPRGIPQEMFSDVFGNLRRVREYQFGANNEPLLYSETAYTYDVRDHLILVQDGKGITTSLRYDALGRKVRMDDPDMGRWTYTYDALGNLTRQTDALGQQTHFAYDALNRVIRQWDSRGGEATYGYDEGSFALGQRTSLIDAYGQATWQYDQRGRVRETARSFTIGASESYTFSFRYDSADRLLSKTNPRGRTVRQVYNLRGLPEQWSSTDGLLSQVRYDIWGRVTQATQGSETTTYTYYPQRQPVQGGHLKRRQYANLVDLRYRYDENGNIKDIWDYSQGMGGERQSYSYDHLDRLTQTKVTHEAAQEGSYFGAVNYQYSYDQVGNMLSRAGQTYQYTDTSHVHAVTRVGENGYVYDANGNMITRQEGGKSYQQGWTVGNKLESVTWEDRGWTCRVAFGYDGDGVRLWKREYLPRPLGVVVRLTLYAGYGYEEGYVEEVMPHEAGAGEPPSDVCGKVVGVTDLGFTGQRQEISFGLYDYNARYFSPALGRFISPDSIVPDPSNPQAWNRYAYVFNNPLKYTDPTGHQPPDLYDPWRELRQLWQHIFPVDRPSQDLSDIVPDVAPDVSIFVAESTAVEGEVMVGAELSYTEITAFHLRTGHLTKLDGLTLSSVVGTPEILSVDGSYSAGFFVTPTNDNFIGPAVVTSEALGVDAILQGTFQHERAVMLQDFWNDPQYWQALEAGDLDEISRLMSSPAIHPATDQPLETHSIGLSVGVNVFPNAVDFETTRSPGLNYTWKRWEIPIYNLIDTFRQWSGDR